MNQALGNKAAAWADCVVGFVAGSLAFRKDMPALARDLAGAAWREGCPRAVHLLDEAAQGCRRIRLRTPSSLACSAVLIAWPAGEKSGSRSEHSATPRNVPVIGSSSMRASTYPSAT